MNVDEFWEIVARVHQASGGDMKLKCDLLERELRQRSRAEIRSFETHFNACLDRAYDWNLWGAAFVIRHGCGEASFRDFRSTLISIGREFYEQALAHPESLAGADLDARTVAYEGYQHVPRKIMGEDPKPEGAPEAPVPTAPARKPTGIPFQEWEMSKRYPKLAAKYNYRDSDWVLQKKEPGQNEKNLEYRIGTAEGERTVQGLLVELLLDAGIVPPSGWIPPRKVMTRVLLEGQFVNGLEKQTSWLPFELTEEDYWATVSWLEKADSGYLARRWPELKSQKLKHDQTVPRNDEFPAWILSLKTRGLLK
jgi:uncharacterized protein DUF4240